MTIECDWFKHAGDEWDEEPCPFPVSLFYVSRHGRLRERCAKHPLDVRLSSWDGGFIFREIFYEEWVVLSVMER